MLSGKPPGSRLVFPVPLSIQPLLTLGTMLLCVRDFCDGLREGERESWLGWWCVNHSCHMALPAAVAPGSAQGLRKTWPELSPCLEAGQPAAGCSTMLKDARL